ncbi:hypothetical protein [Microvirga brassicacearum]|uniref:Uncharacterized protein n=1 Tax=Microvirga brassicacearum TaxID=2580413 RepID=A0A5N3PHB4_9HYPH|nr:hypothetical protein [Microvirga brassicacearum]KAB0269045.1 hypothetical protein FEZ63_02755 [Microvirga brassicacearum]
MPKFVTTRDLEFMFQGLHHCRVKAGTPVRWQSGGTGGYVVEPAHVELPPTQARGRGTLWAHDTHYHFIWIESDAVAEAEG